MKRAQSMSCSANLEETLVTRHGCNPVRNETQHSIDVHPGAPSSAERRAAGLWSAHFYGMRLSAAASSGASTCSLLSLLRVAPA